MLKNGMQMRKAQGGNHLKLLIVGVLVFAVCYGAVQFYGQYQSKEAEVASSKYEAMMENIHHKNYSAAKEVAQDLLQNYSKTPYAPLATLMLAKLAVDENNLQVAEENLKTTLKIANKGPLQPIARVRLAKVLAQRKNYTEALEVLNNVKTPDGFVTLYEETKGDIYLMQNEVQKARLAYDTALKAAPPGTPVSSLQLKYNDLNEKEGS